MIYFIINAHKKQPHIAGHKIAVPYRRILYHILRGSLTLPFKPHNTQILYLSLLWAYFFVKFVKIMCASLH